MCAHSPTRKGRVEFNQGGKTCIREVFKLIYADSRFNWAIGPLYLVERLNKNIRGAVTTWDSTPEADEAT